MGAQIGSLTMKYWTSPRIRLIVDNPIRRPSEQAEKHSRRIGTAKRAGYAMAARFVRRLSKEVMV